MKNGFVALFVGILFGIGLAISGMTQPQKVIGFLDIFGKWDPSLAFVMIGAISVHLFAYRIARKRTSPYLAEVFHIPTKKEIDRSLVIGSILFGLGWGLGGYCPGPAITSVVSLDSQVFVFLAAIAVGMLTHEKWAKIRVKA